MDRREFFGAGLTAGLGVGAGAMLAGAGAEAAPVAAAMMGRSVLEFGVEANTETDQSGKLQRALNEIAASGHPALLPPGVYTLHGLELPSGVHIHGTGAHLSFRTGGAFIRGGSARLSHLGFAGTGVLAIKLANAGSGALLSSLDCDMMLENCVFANTDDWAIRAEGGRLTMTGGGIRNAGGGLALEAKSPADNAIVSGVRLTHCGAAGIEAKGRAIVTGNMIDGCGYGLKLGDAKGTSHILAAQNSIVNCRVGIACEAEGDYIFATLNMIQGAKDGAIRAIADGKLVGPDLSQRSAESFRNLAVAGNVAL